MAFAAAVWAEIGAAQEKKEEEVDKGCMRSKRQKDTQLQSLQRVVADEGLGQGFRPVFLDHVVLEAVRRPISSFRNCASHSLGLRRGKTLLFIRAL